MQAVFEKIIEKLESEAKRWEDSGTEYKDKCEIAVGKGLRNAIEIVKQEAEKHNNGWIPCSERLPENNNVVLCWVVSRTIASGETFIIGSCDHGFWFLQTYEIGHHHFPVKDYEVVAWMPLPEPYQPKGE